MSSRDRKSETTVVIGTAAVESNPHAVAASNPHAAGGSPVKLQQQLDEQGRLYQKQIAELNSSLELSRATLHKSNASFETLEHTLRALQDKCENLESDQVNARAASTLHTARSSVSPMTAADADVTGRAERTKANGSRG